MIVTDSIGRLTLAGRMILAAIIAGACAAAGCGGTALTKAASKGQTEQVRLLLERGADINEKPFVCENGFSAWSGRGTALVCAAGKGHTKTIELLLDRGAYVDTVDSGFGSSGFTALAAAAFKGHVGTAKLLIKKGADVDAAMAILNNKQLVDAAKLLERLREEPPPARPLPRPAPALRSDIDELPAGRAKLNKNAYAIVIGIENYRQKLPKADFAVQDAVTVSDYLAKVLGYPEENIVTLTGERAALGDFVKYFEKWLPNQVEPGATVFVYYSGHGAPDPKTSNAYLVPYDGDPTFVEETGYSLKKLYSALGKLPAKDIVVVLDSCFSGAGGRSVLAKGSRPLVTTVRTDTALPANMTVLAASAGDQSSSTYDEKGHGLLTYFLLKGIREEDVKGSDGSLRMEELFGYLRPQVERIARKRYNNEQTPQLYTGTGRTPTPR